MTNDAIVVDFDAHKCSFLFLSFATECEAAVFISDRRRSFPSEKFTVYHTTCPTAMISLFAVAGSALNLSRVLPGLWDLAVAQLDSEGLESPDSSVRCAARFKTAGGTITGEVFQNARRRIH
jgi:hypothetical protein